MEKIKIDEKAIKELAMKAMKEILNTKPLNCEPEVRVLADSISADKKRLITFECKFWRPILPEVTRHRSLSFSVRSSRAVPIEKLILEAQENTWGPKHWGTEQKGMVAGEEKDEKIQKYCSFMWRHAMKESTKMANSLKELGIHKQDINRLLEPFTCTHAVISGTEWDNFFKLRISPLAQPEMYDLAVAMKNAMDSSEPVEMKSGDYHLPYLSAKEKDELKINDAIMVSAARCARVSYKLFDGSTSIDKDLELGSRLINDSHWSPFEHVATPTSDADYKLSNFKGWNQARKFLEKE